MEIDDLLLSLLHRTLEIPKLIVLRILHEYLNTTKLCARFRIPRCSVQENTN